LIDTNLQSKVYRDGEEEAPEAYNLKVTRMKIR
jgi:hypothetical protein